MSRKVAAVKQPRNADGGPRVASDPIELESPPELCACLKLRKVEKVGKFSRTAVQTCQCRLKLQSS